MGSEGPPSPFCSTSQLLTLFEEVGNYYAIYLTRVHTIMVKLIYNRNFFHFQYFSEEPSFVLSLSTALNAIMFHSVCKTLLKYLFQCS